ncbi:MAG: hotdog fold thioesterase [Cyclobacteriaceae bacterium]
MKVDEHVVKMAIEEMIPIHKFLGLELVEIRKGFVKVRVPFKEEVIGDFRNRRWHGGILATVMDSVGGIAGSTHFTSMEDILSTIDIRIDYLKGAESSAIVVEGEIVRFGNRIVVTRMRTFQEETDTLLAEGTGVYNYTMAGTIQQSI